MENKIITFIKNSISDELKNALVFGSVFTFNKTTVEIDVLTEKDERKLQRIFKEINRILDTQSKKISMQEYKHNKLESVLLEVEKNIEHIVNNQARTAAAIASTDEQVHKLDDSIAVLRDMDLTHDERMEVECYLKKEEAKELLHHKKYLVELYSKPMVSVTEFTEIYKISRDRQGTLRNRPKHENPLLAHKGTGRNSKIFYIVTEIDEWLQNESVSTKSYF